MFIGIDIGGTHIRIASGQKGKIDQRLDFPTKEFQASIQEIKKAVESLATDENVEGIGVGVPGPLETKTGKLAAPPHMVGWQNVFLAEILSKLLNKPVRVAHDASVAALGEYVYGAGKGKNPLLYVTVSTGIGIGLIVHGKIYSGVFNPEAGHQILGLTGTKCACGQEADLEVFSSGDGLKIITGKHPVEVEGTEIWDRAMEWLGVGFANLILHYSPEILVVGGGMTKHQKQFFPLVEASLKKHLHQLPPVPLIPAGLGQNSGLIGALTLAERS